MLSTNTITLNSKTKTTPVVWHNNQFKHNFVDVTVRTASWTNLIKD